jgi:DNA-binding NtrC family response regulator
MSATPAALSSSSSPLRHWVLVVDDEAPIRDLLSEVFVGLDLEFRSAAGAVEGLAQIAGEQTEPLLVLTDVVMPGVDGLTFARELQKRLKHSQIVVMSGKLADTSWWPTDLREVAFLPKPLELAALARLVHEARLQYPEPR